MRTGAIIFFLVLAALLLLLDLYVFQGIKSLTANLRPAFLRQTVHGTYWLVSGAFPVMISVLYLQTGRMNSLFMTVGSLFLTLLVTKLMFVTILAGGDLYRAAEGGFNWLANNAGDEGFVPGRRRFVSQLALGVAAIPFTSFLYGIVKGKYDYKVHRHTLWFDDLPEAFNGFTITQISDIHSGSFDDLEAVRRGVELVNAQKSDLFVFTGDIVNSVASEFEPWIDVFKEIKAPYGQYSILGNHDYGDYHQWSSEGEKKLNLAQLIRHHAATGFRLLLDENVTLEKDGEKISLLGVENWGVGFGKRGNLKKALHDVPEDAFKILLSHDPSHWDSEVKSFDTHIHLTLSGHTHGMQMGVEIPGLRWSPSKYRYPKWAGVYEEAGKFINVNRGFGFLGFSGRIGIWPEITVLELRRKGTV